MYTYIATRQQFKAELVRRVIYTCKLLANHNPKNNSIAIFLRHSSSADEQVNLTLLTLEHIERV